MLKVISLLVFTVKMSKQEVVTTVQGQIRGVKNDGFITYAGIPYANTSYDDRFKRAGVAPSWSGIRESQSSRDSCSSSSSVGDCLQLDVHVPTRDEGAPWPVLVWVPSGSAQYNPKKFADEGIIVVTVNYRNGPLGFLCLDDQKIPGNAGAKDLILALRWVQDNIVAFRGSPTQVVVAGQSYGAAMVEAAMLSPMSEGLFHGVLLQSGSILSPWAFNYDAGLRAEQLGQILSLDSGEDQTVSAILRADTSELMDISRKLDLAYFPFGICLEKEFEGEERFLHGSPVELLANNKSRRVPMIIGYNTDEAYVFKLNLKRANAVKRMAGNMRFILPHELLFFDEHEVNEVLKQIKEIYFNDNLTMAAMLAYHRDVYFVQHIYRSARFHAQNDQPVYMYQFSHASEPGVESEVGVRKTGAAHSDELAYLFSEKGRVYEGDDGAVQGELVQLWTNFVKYLNPTPSLDESVRWEPLMPGQVRVYDIALRSEMRDFPYEREMHFWGDIYDKYYYRRQDS